MDTFKIDSPVRMMSCVWIPSALGSCQLPGCWGWAKTEAADTGGMDPDVEPLYVYATLPTGSWHPPQPPTSPPPTSPHQPPFPRDTHHAGGRCYVRTSTGDMGPSGTPCSNTCLLRRPAAAAARTTSLPSRLLWLHTQVEQYMQAALGAQTFAAMQAALAAPPLHTCVRVNTLRMTPQVGVGAPAVC